MPVLGRDDTVTVQNPTPPTNIPCYGGTPPTDPALDAEDVAAPADPTTWGAPEVFAAAVSGEEPEGAGAEDSVVVEYTNPPHVDTVLTSVNNEDYVNVGPPSINASHPSSPDYEAP